MTDTKKLEERIKKSGLSYKHIAKKIGISYYSLRKKMDNQVEFKSSEIDALCSILDIESFEETKELFFAKRVDLKSTN